jgi:predicted ATPase
MSHFSGREREIAKLAELLDMADIGQGSAALISGEPGIGKSRLVEEIKKSAASNGFSIMEGACAHENAHPFLPFIAALKGLTSAPLFEDQEHVSFSQIFAISPSGMLIAKASHQEDELDADIFAGMLTAVQSFVRDSFDSSGTATAGLGRLEYGSMKIMIEHGQHMFLVAVLKEKEHVDMAKSLKTFLKELEEEHGHLLDKWTGSMSQVKPIENGLKIKIQSRFLVRKDLEGIKIEAERLRISENVLAILDEQAGKSPILLVLEDLHWADDNSLFVFRHLARNIGKSKILMLATARPSENKALESTISEMKSDGMLEDIALEEMNADNAQDLLDRLYSPNIIPKEFMAKLASQCRGNPFFMRELLAQMASDGAILLKDGKYILDREDYEIPKSVEDVLNMRLAGLDTDAMAMAEFASCFGQQFKVDMIQSIQNIPDPAAALNKLQTSGILSRCNGSAEFSHALFQNVVYSNIADRWKSIHHLQIGILLEEKFKERLDDIVFELARHYSKSREHQKALVYSIKAAEKAEASFAVEQAIEYYRQALNAIDRLGRGAEPRKRAELLERLADMLVLAEKLDEALDLYKQAYNLVDTNMDKSRLRRKRAHAFTLKSDFDTALDEARLAESEAESESAARWMAHYEQSDIFSRKGMTQESLDAATESLKHLEILGGHERELATIENTMGVCHWHLGDYGKALEYFQRSLESKKLLNDIRGMASSYQSIAIVHCDMGRMDEALEIQKQVLKMDTESKNLRGVASSHGNIGVFLQRKGAFREAYESTLTSKDLFVRIGDKQGLARTFMNLGVMVSELGDSLNAKDHFMKAYEMFTAMNDKQGTGIVVYFIGGVLWELGDIDEAEKWLERSLVLNEEIGEMQRILGSKLTLSELRASRGQRVEAEAIQRECLGKAREMNDIEATVSAIVALASNLLEQGKFSDARAAITEAFEKSKEHTMQLYEAMSHDILARVEAKSGNIDKATEHFDDADRIFSEIQASAQQARVMFHRGQALRATGMDDKGMIQKALDEFEKRGMKEMARQARETLESN